MLSTYFKRNTTLSEFYKSPAGLYLDEFTDWLSDRGFHTETIRRRIQGTVHFNDWIHVNNIKMENLAPDVMKCHCGWGTLILKRLKFIFVLIQLKS